MASIRITRFAGILPQLNPKQLPNDHAQMAHNCLLWDGWLRPMPQWTAVETLAQTPAGLYKNTSATNGYSSDYYIKDGVANTIEPFNSNRLTGIFKRFLLFDYLAHYTFTSHTAILGVPAPTISSHNFVISAGNKSVYPISRTYAVTYSSLGQEGPPTVFEQIGTNGTLFEGDSVAITLAVDNSQITQYGISTLKIYRTVPGFDTSEQIGNPVETGFHLVGTAGFDPFSGVPGGIINFTDQLDSTQIQGDLLISDQWIPPPYGSQNVEPLFFGQTEGGWMVEARYAGTVGNAPCAVQFSERYMSHAWPMQNTLLVPDAITGMAIYYDNVFIGTKNVAYHINVQAGEQETLNIHMEPFFNTFACAGNTMTATNFGAMYASRDGLVALMVNEDRIASKRVASPGDGLPTPINTIHFNDAVDSAWWNGNYFGFTTQSIGYIFNQPAPSNNEFPLGQLTTIDTPATPPVDNITTGKGLYGVWANIVYNFPLPGYGYESASKASYTWKSKRYVMPGLTTFAGAKVVNDNSGNLTVTINGYNDGGESTPEFTYSRALAHSEPFRIPHQQRCLEWEIILQGTSVVQEVHLATSYRDLVEEPNSG